jgi:hypothetical protein
MTLFEKLNMMMGKNEGAVELKEVLKSNLGDKNENNINQNKPKVRAPFLFDDE